MLHGFVLFIGVLIAGPDLSLRWSTALQESLTATVSEQNVVLNQCLDSGFKIRFRYQIRFCRSDGEWFGQCGSDRTIIRTLDYDSITEGYRFSEDTLGDGKEGTIEMISDRSLGISALSLLEKIPVDTSVGSKYANIRVITECKGEYNETLARLGYLLTFGLVRFHQSDTGWVRFALQSAGKQ